MTISVLFVPSDDDRLRSHARAIIHVNPTCYYFSRTSSVNVMNFITRLNAANDVSTERLFFCAICHNRPNSIESRNGRSVRKQSAIISLFCEELSRKSGKDIALVSVQALLVR